MNFSIKTRCLGVLLKCCAATFLAVSAAHASVIYTFTANTRPSLGSPSHPESFQLELTDFLPVSNGGPVISFFRTGPEVTSCVACTTGAVQALHFLRTSDSDLIQ